MYRLRYTVPLVVGGMSEQRGGEQRVELSARQRAEIARLIAEIRSFLWHNVLEFSKQVSHTTFLSQFVIRHAINSRSCALDTQHERRITHFCTGPKYFCNFDRRLQGEAAGVVRKVKDVYRT